jgi:hypothetical protein
MAFTGVLAVATVFLTVATAGLWHYAAEQAEDMKSSIREAQRAANAAEQAAVVAKQTLESSERPFVFVKSIGAVVVGDRVRIHATFENSGSSPTRNTRSRAMWKLFPTEPPSDYAYPDLDANGQVDLTKENKPAFVGPKGTTLSAKIEIPLSSIELVVRKAGRIFIWGWIEYDDLIPSSPRHRTEFCNEVEIQGLGPDVKDPATVTAALSFPLYGRFNTSN